MIDENELLEGQRNIFEVIEDFEKPKTLKKNRLANENIPVPVRTVDWLKMRKINK